MQQAYRPPNAGKVAFLNGLYFGLGAAVLNIVVLVLFVFAARSGGTLVFLLGWLLGLAAFFLAGLFAAKKTGRVGTATLAGLWAAIFNGVLANLTYGVIVFAALSFAGNDLFGQVANSMPATFTPDQFNTVLRYVMVMVLTFCVLLNIGIGAGVAPLGGLIGRSLARKRQASAQQSPYVAPQQQYPGQPPFPPYPVPGQPPYSGQPPYPFPPAHPYGGQPPYPAPPAYPYGGQPPYPVPPAPAQPEPQQQYQPRPDAEHASPYGDQPSHAEANQTAPAPAPQKSDNEQQ